MSGADISLWVLLIAVVVAAAGVYDVARRDVDDLMEQTEQLRAEVDAMRVRAVCR